MIFKSAMKRQGAWWGVGAFVLMYLLVVLFVGDRSPVPLPFGKLLFYKFVATGGVAFLVGLVGLTAVGVFFRTQSDATNRAMGFFGALAFGGLLIVGLFAVFSSGLGHWATGWKLSRNN